MADRTIKPDDTNDLVLSNNDGSSKLELNEDQTVKVTTGSDAGEDFTVNTTQLVVEGDTGNVGIGTASSSIRLRIEQPTGLAYGLYVHGEDAMRSSWAAGANNPRFDVNITSSNVCHVGVNQYWSESSGYASYRLDVNGAIRTTGSDSFSDERLKENITDADIGLTEVLALRPRKFDWQDEPEISPHFDYGSVKTGNYGLIAQEVEAITTGFVTGSDDEIKAIKDKSLMVAMIKAIQELSTKVTTLENA